MTEEKLRRKDPRLRIQTETGSCLTEECIGDQARGQERGKKVGISPEKDGVEKNQTVGVRPLFLSRCD
jgi:hypothetical protein